jgi:glycosyltransferase involved in cell wall biosynthesis
MQSDKLLVITSSFPRWAGDYAGCFVYALVERLAKTYDVTVLAPSDMGALAQETMGRLTVVRHRQGWGAHPNLAYGSGIVPNIIRAPWRILHLPLYLICLLKAINKLIRSEQITLINAHWLYPAGLAAIFYKHFYASQIRVLITGYRADIAGCELVVGRWLKKWLLRKANAVSVANHALVNTVRALGYAGPLTVCPMGVDTAEFSPERKDLPPVAGPEGTARFILFVGSLIKRKGIALLIDAMPAVVKAIPDLGLVVIGEGHDRDCLRDKARHLGIEARIKFVGAQPHNELPSWFARAEALVLPSYSEGYPLVVVEALSSGLIPIVSSIPVFQEIQATEPVLVLMRDWSSAAISETIIGVVSQPERMKNMRARARNYAVRCLDWTVIAGHYRNIIEQMSK